RFYQQVEVVSRLAHPNLVGAFDAGPVGRSHFLATEFIDGIDLEQQVQQSGPLSALAACNFIYQAAIALDHAWQHGLCHHRLQAADLLLTRRPDPTEPVDPADSASSSLAERSSGDLIKVRNLGLTFPGPVFPGKECQGLDPADFQAPEQAAGASVD